MTTTASETEHIIRKNVIWATAAGAVPIPFLDLAAVTAIQLDMLRALCQFYDVEYSTVRGKALISSISGSLMARYWASFLKGVPGIGAVIGSFSMSIMSGASTYALGKVFDKYLREEGSLEAINETEAIKLFKKKFKEGRNYAKWVRTAEKDIYEQLDKLGALKEKGIITEEEFQEKKKTLLDKIK